MRRIALLSVIFLASCLDPDGGTTPDAMPMDELGMSGSALFGVDPSPPDVTLEWMVLGLSAILVGGSLHSRRRDERTKFDL